MSVFLARVLGVDGFANYNVAVATVILLASLTSLGLEKYAVRSLSAYYEQRNWNHARGFTIFSRNMILLAAGIVAVAYVAISLAWAGVSEAEVSGPNLFAVSFLPVIVLVLLLVELVTANGAVVRATVVYRILLPATAFALSGAVWLWRGELSPIWAVACYSASWVVAMIALFVLARRTFPAEVWAAEASRTPRVWLQQAIAFLIHSVMMTQFASLGIVVLELVDDTETSVALYSAAMQSGGFIVLLATATNRFYGPIASVMIERHDYSGMRKAIRERHTWIIPATLVYLLAIILLGKKILGLYGPDFTAAYPALCMIAAGASVSVWFAMAPNYLKFIGRGNLVLGVTAVAGVLNILLLLLWARPYGATGAGAAYGISLASMAIVFFGLGLRSIHKQQERANAPASKTPIG
jgi:O-antigen/teichoic acid export membrane protein